MTRTLKTLLALVIVLACGSAFSQTCVPGNGVTCSPNMNLWLPPLHYPNWNIVMNSNWTNLDTNSANWAKLNAINQTFTGTVTAAGFVGPLTGTVTGHSTLDLSLAGGTLSGALNLTIPLSISSGGTGASTAAGALANLGTIPNPQGCSTNTAATKCLGVSPYTAVSGDYSAALQQAITDIYSTGGGAIYLQCGATYPLNGPLQDTAGANAVIVLPKVAQSPFVSTEVGISIIGCTSPIGLLGVPTAGSTLQTNLNNGNLFGGYISTGPHGGMITSELYLYNMSIISTQTNPGSVMVNGKYFAGLSLQNVFIGSQASSIATSANGTGVWMPTGGNDLRNYLYNVAVSGFTTPYILGEHTTFGSLLADLGTNCYVFDSQSTQGNGISGTYIWQQVCTNMIAGGSSPTVINVQLADSEVAITNFCYDPSNMLYGDIWVHIPYNDVRSTSTTLRPAITGCANLRIHNALTGACFGSTCPLSILASNTEAWNSQDGSGTVGYNSGADVSNPLAFTNIGWASGTGYPANVATYNGTTSYATATTNDEWNGTTPRTVCAWVNPTSIPATNATYSIIGDMQTGGTETGWRMDDFGAGGIGNVLVYMVSNISGNYIETRSNVSPIQASQNNLVCFSTDGSRTVAGMMLYINGFNQPLSTASDTLTGSISSGLPVLVGAATSGTTQFFPGVIARTKIWNRVLSQGEVAVLWSAGPTVY